MPDCAWTVGETAGDVEVLVLTYARAHYGELPEPSILGPLRAERVAGVIEGHLHDHPEGDEPDWLARFLPPNRCR